ncbi:Putative phage-related protein [Methyloversatilis universalis FAM5]|uniref:Phage-related protein n=1 Tax=Methyloversatilis universalis (strain ATCC BAA-1314 / DSM 25237 / JCM 13912 / CCUG 52030 / FAM5) TaxID=1000565 RepID=F5R8A2_METUF|nr:phage major capsid protein [Methyloversatilis universalis]EGK73360.1 Putative phage-related protein [Methyloversatilis universalis FAM5]
MSRLIDLSPSVTTRDYFQPQADIWSAVTDAYVRAERDERAAFLRAIPHVVNALPLNRAAIDAEARTVPIAFSSEEPYERWWGVEILSHDPGAVDLSRMNNGGAVLVEHSTRDHVGVVVQGSAAIDADRTGRCVARYGKSARSEEIFTDVQDGIRTLISVGYMIDELVLVKSDQKTGIDTYRATRWTPYEVSHVAVPADPTVGVGRSKIFVSGFKPANSAAPSRATQESIMPEDNLDDGGAAVATRTQQQQQAPAAPATSVQTVGDAITAERARMRDIRAVGKQWGMGEQAEQAIDAGMSVDAFRAKVMAELQDTGRVRVAESPEIGMSDREIESFSFCRALLAAHDPLNAHKIAPLENEASRAAQQKRGERTGREGSITLPADVLLRSLRVDAQKAGAAVRSLFALHGLRGQSMHTGIQMRDLVVGTPTAGGNLVATDLLGSSFIELFRNAVLFDELGVTMLTNLSGNIAIPRQTGGATAYWVAENGAPTESQQSVDQVSGTPKTVGCFTDYSRRLLLQSSIDVELFVRSDLALQMAQEAFRAAINGSGSSNEPTGLMNISGTGAVVGGTNGAAPTYDHIVDLESAVANANADGGRLAYLTNTKVRGKLRKTQEFASTNGKPVWTSAPGGAGRVGELLGYNAYTSNAVPSNLTKGTSSGVCSGIAYGNWAELLIFMWGGLDLMFDPYSLSTTGAKRLVALQDMDVNVRHATSFAVMKDALTS